MLTTQKFTIIASQLYQKIQSIVGQDSPHLLKCKFQLICSEDPVKFKGSLCSLSAIINQIIFQYQIKSNRNNNGFGMGHSIFGGGFSLGLQHQQPQQQPVLTQEQKKEKEKIQALKIIKKQCIEISKQISHIMDNELKNRVKQYFNLTINADNIKIIRKQHGITQGFAISLQFNDGSHPIKYYCKDHFLSAMSRHHLNEIHRVDLREIFLYKLFQYIGIGPQVHFLYKNMKQMTIITKDVAYCDKEEYESVQFLTFEEIQKDSRLMKEKERQIKQGIILIDAISYIIKLNDVLSNLKNFGYRLINKKQLQIMIIDSLPPKVCKQTPAQQRYQYNRIFQSWLESDHQFSVFQFQSRFILQILKPNIRKEDKRSEQLPMRIKLKQARQVFTKLKELKLNNLIKDARRFILNLVKDPLLDATYLQLLDLDAYTQSMSQNYNVLMRQYFKQMMFIEQNEKYMAENKQLFTQI